MREKSSVLRTHVLVSFRPGFAWQKVLEFAGAVNWTYSWLASANMIRSIEHVLRGLVD